MVSRRRSSSSPTSQARTPPAANVRLALRGSEVNAFCFFGGRLVVVVVVEVE